MAVALAPRTLPSAPARPLAPTAAAIHAAVFVVTTAAYALLLACILYRAVGLRAHAVVRCPCCALQLVVPLRAQAPERALVTGLREGVGLRRGLDEAAQCVESDRGAGPTYRADGRISRPVRFCSRM